MSPTTRRRPNGRVPSADARNERSRDLPVSEDTPDEPSEIPSPSGWASVAKINLYLGAIGLAILFGIYFKQTALQIPTEAFVAFALFFIAALAIERLLEPIASLIEMLTRSGSRLQTRANVSSVTTGAAVVLGVLASGLLGLFLIESVASEFVSNNLNRTVDVLISGLAMGAGTKPLHDLIGRIEKGKEKAEETVLKARSA